MDWSPGYSAKWSGQLAKRCNREGFTISAVRRLTRRGAPTADQVAAGGDDQRTVRRVAAQMSKQLACSRAAHRGCGYCWQLRHRSKSRAPAICKRDQFAIGRERVDDLFG